MRNDSGGRQPRALLGPILHGRDAVHFVRCRGNFPLSVGGNSARSQTFWAVGDVRVHRDRVGGLLLYMEEGHSGMGPCTGAAGGDVNAIGAGDHRFGTTERTSGGSAAIGVELIVCDGGEIGSRW